MPSDKRKRGNNSRGAAAKAPSLRSKQSAIATDNASISSDEEVENVVGTSHSTGTRPVAVIAVKPKRSLLDHEIITKPIEGEQNESQSGADAASTSISDVTPFSKDYRLHISVDGHKMVVRSMVKSELFRQCKFIDKSTDAAFDADERTVCGFLLAACNVEKDRQRQWWDNSFHLVKRVMTDHRNNVIKSIRKAFLGE